MILRRTGLSVSGVALSDDLTRVVTRSTRIRIYSSKPPSTPFVSNLKYMAPDARQICLFCFKNMRRFRIRSVLLDTLILKAHRCNLRMAADRYGRCSHVSKKTACRMRERIYIHPALLDLCSTGENTRKKIWEISKVERPRRTGAKPMCFRLTRRIMVSSSGMLPRLQIIDLVLQLPHIRSCQFDHQV